MYENTANGCRMAWVTGEVNKVDWVGSKFSLRPYGPAPGYGDWCGVWTYPSTQPDVRFLVTEDTLFVQQTDTLNFTQLEQSDYVSVLFCMDFSAEPRAIQVVINNSYPKN